MKELAEQQGMRERESFKPTPASQPSAASVPSSNVLDERPKNEREPQDTRVCNVFAEFPDVGTKTRLEASTYACYAKTGHSLALGNIKQVITSTQAKTHGGDSLKHPMLHDPATRCKQTRPVQRAGVRERRALFVHGGLGSTLKHGGRTVFTEGATKAP